MACDTPVVCSNTTSFPEVVGDAALMVDPLDVDELAEMMSQALRAQLSSTGRVRHPESR